MAAKKHHKKHGKKHHHKAGGKGHVPLKILEKRLVKLNNVVKARKGKHL